MLAKFIYTERTIKDGDTCYAMIVMRIHVQKHSWYVPASQGSSFPVTSVTSSTDFLTARKDGSTVSLCAQKSNTIYII